MFTQNLEVRWIDGLLNEELLTLNSEEKVEVQIKKENGTEHRS